LKDKALQEFARLCYFYLHTICIQLSECGIWIGKRMFDGFLPIISKMASSLYQMANHCQRMENLSLRPVYSSFTFQA
jgi:hypothetical protein